MSVDLNQMLVFTRVVKAGSFRAAARELDMPKSTVSRKVAELEQRLGARLLQRTTRKLHLTDVGHAYHQHAARAIAEALGAEEVVTQMQQAPRGLLRITVPLNFGYLSAQLADFVEKYPELQLEIFCSDRVVDLVDEGFDLAIRAGRLVDSTLMARPLGVLRSVLVASPECIARQGHPRTPAELPHYDCIVFGGSSERGLWRLVNAGVESAVNVRSRFVVNDFDIVEQGALLGLGIALLTVDRCAAALSSGRLVRILPDWSSRELTVHAVYPSARQLSPKVKAFVDHLVTAFAALPQRFPTDS